MSSLSSQIYETTNVEDRRSSTGLILCRPQPVCLKTGIHWMWKTGSTWKFT